MRSFCFEIIYGILLIVQKGHSTPDGQRVALNVRPLQPKRFFLAKPAVQTEGAEYAGAWFYDYTHQNIDLIGKQSLFLFRFSVRGDFDKLIKKGLVQKRTEVVNGIKHNYYLAAPRGSLKIRPPQSNFYTGVVQNLDHPSPNFRPNNIEDNIEDILVIEDGGTRKKDPRLDADLSKIINAYQANIGTWPRILTDDLQRWREQFSTEMLLLAISEGAKNGAHMKTAAMGLPPALP